MKELIGYECVCAFDMPYEDWPISYPGYVQVLDVDMPMVKLSAHCGGDATWVNAAKIKQIRALHKADPPRKLRPSIQLP